MKKCALLLSGLILGIQCFGGAEWKPAGKWKAGENQTYLLKIPANTWCGYFTGSADVKKDTHYRLAFTASNQTVPDPLLVSIQGKDRRIFREFLLNKKALNGHLYWTAKEDGKVKITFHFRCKKDLDAVLTNLNWQEVKPGGNLLVNPDFENPVGLAGDWDAKGRIRLGNESCFGIGKHCLQISTQDKKGGSAFGRSMPIYPGETMELRFVAKGKPGARLRAWITCWSPFKHQGKAYWASRDFKLTSEWTEYSFKTVISKDFNEYPDLADGLGQPGFYLLPNGGEVMIDNLFFGIAPAENAAKK